MRTRTKIVCTMGPAVNSLEKILELIQAGMNVARLNFSHGSHAEHLKTINLLKQAREIAQVPLAIMLDTKGPEIRTGIFKDNRTIQLEKGMTVTLVCAEDNVEGDELSIPINPGHILQALKPG